MQEVIQELERLRHRTRVILIIQHAAVVLSWAIGVALALTLIDYVLRLPGFFRLLLLLGGVSALILGVWRYFLKSVAFRPSLVELALRIERSIPTLSGRLASSVEFAVSGLDETNALAGRSVRDAQSRLAGASVASVVRPNRLVRDGGVCMALVVVLGVIVIVNPAAARTGAMRLFAPLSSAAWPARTAVESLMHEVLEHTGVHPRGTVLRLRARNQTEGGADERVEAHYRTQAEGRFGSWEKVLLTHQGAGVHERLVDSNAQAIEVWFTTEDARTEVEHIRLEAPPAVRSAVLEVTPPMYAVGRIDAVNVDLGPGVDQRARTDQPSLHGSAVTLTLTMNKRLQDPPPSGPTEAWIREVTGWSAGDAPALDVAMNDADDATVWRMSWTLDDSQVLDLALRDRFGLRNDEPIVYGIDAVADLPPSVAMTIPEADETVLGDALIDLAGEAKDDVAVARVGIEARVLRSDVDPRALAFDANRLVDAAVASVDATLDLSDHDVVIGDVIEVVAVADDVFDLDGRQHETVASTPRRLRVIGELEFAAEIRRGLSAVRQNSIRMEAIQSELQDDVAQNGRQPGQDRAQAQIAERIAAQRGVVDQLERQMERNRLEDEALGELLQQSRDLLDYAGRAAFRAVESMGRTEAAPDGDPNEQDVVDAQQEVREELTDLIKLLDRDEDTWLVRQRLENLLEAQRRLEASTSRLAPETIGQELEDLTDEQRRELNDIGQQERELVDQVQQLIEEMRRRAAAMQEIDANASAGMRTAADTAEQREVDRDMEQAAEQVEENRLQSAAGAQQAAIKTLERMVEDIEETNRARSEELLRALASLIESIDRLIAVQENEIIALATAVETDNFSGRDRAMIRLHQNTQSVAGDARAAGPDSRRIARVLDRAADAQGGAVTSLRARPVEADAANEAEERSLTLLKEAKDAAAELERETQEDQVQQRREELIAAYRALAEQQVTLRETTLELADGAELTRRDRVTARRLGNEQQTIREGLDHLGTSTNEIVDSGVFRFVHEMMDDWCAIVSDRLWEAQVDVEATDRQLMIAESIARQIEAIEATMAQDEQNFANAGGQDSGGSGGGSSPPPLIPPVAELRRLHGLQDQVYRETRRLDERDDLDASRRDERVRELGRVQGHLIELGEGLVESMTNPGGGGGPSVTPIPIPDPDEDEQPTSQPASGDDDR